MSKASIKMSKSWGKLGTTLLKSLLTFIIKLK